jgi:hypothetical protein
MDFIKAKLCLSAGAELDIALLDGGASAASERDPSRIRLLQRSIAEQDEHIIAALRKGEDTAELERKVSNDLTTLNGFRNALSRRVKQFSLTSENRLPAA